MRMYARDCARQVWGPNMRVLGVTCIDSCYVLTKCTLNHTMRQSQCVVQLSADKLVLAPADGSQSRLLECQMQIAGLDVHESHLAVWSGKKVRRPRSAHNACI